MHHFLSTKHYSRQQLEAFLEAAIRQKASRDAGKPLSGKSVALVFFNPSLRTRASMQIAIYELGGNPVVLEPGSTSWSLEYREGVVMDGNKTEHLKEFVRVLGRYVAAVGVRCFAALEDWETERQDPILNAIVRYSDVPIFNLESAMHHPFQAMADMMTLREHFGSRKPRVLLTWAYHPKPLPMAVPNSFALAAAQMGFDLRIAHPKGYELDDEILADLRSFASINGSELEFTDDPVAAFENVDAVYAKSWGSKNFYGNLSAEAEYRAPLREQWIVDEAKMEIGRSPIFMHCLPVRRNVVVTDGVIDSPNSVVIDEAENRLHIQKAILSEILK
jgi:N-acetylornithine carbamoyltransferase